MTIHLVLNQRIGAGADGHLGSEPVLPHFVSNLFGKHTSLGLGEELW